MYKSKSRVAFATSLFLLFYFLWRTPKATCRTTLEPEKILENVLRARLRTATSQLHGDHVSHGICWGCLEAGLEWSAEQERRIRFLAELNGRVWNAGREGNPSDMEKCLDDGSAAGIRAIDLLFGLAGAALAKVGDLWARGELTVRDEHRFSDTCEGLLALVESKVGELMPASSDCPKVLLAPVPGNEFVGFTPEKNALASTVVPARSTLNELSSLRQNKQVPTWPQV